MRLTTTRTGIAVAIAMVIASCGGGSDSGANGAVTTPTTVDDVDDAGSAGAVETTAAPAPTTGATTTTTTTAAPLAVADAVAIEPSVDVRLAAATSFTPVDDPLPVAVGDTVRTDATGYAEVAFFDGSIARLDVETEFEVLELVDDVTGATIRTRMGIGRTWHRVQEFGEAGEYSVETSVATAVVQGTAFVIGCPTTTVCRFAVAEGTVDVELPDGRVITLVAPAGIEIDADDPGGPDEPVALPFDTVFDDWVFDNGQRDVGAGYVSPGAMYEPYGPAFAALTGAFTASLVDRVDYECVSDCEFWAAWLGELTTEVRTRTYAFEQDCVAFPCTLEATIELASGPREVTAVLTGTTISFTVDLDSTDTMCVVDEDGDGVDDYESGVVTSTEIEFVLDVSDAAIVDDRWAATALQGELGQTFTVTDVGDCLTFENQAPFDWPAVGSSVTLVTDITAEPAG
jgi:hypothetical protein